MTLMRDLRVPDFIYLGTLILGCIAIFASFYLQPLTGIVLTLIGLVLAAIAHYIVKARIIPAPLLEDNEPVIDIVSFSLAPVLILIAQLGEAGTNTFMLMSLLFYVVACTLNRVRMIHYRRRTRVRDREIKTIGISPKLASLAMLLLCYFVPSIYVCIPIVIILGAAVVSPLKFYESFNY